MIDKVGVLYHPKISRAESLSKELQKLLNYLNVEAWLCSAWEDDRVKEQLIGTDLALSVGGDGTLLRVARAAACSGTYVTGLNLGKLGFMTELRADEVKTHIPRLLGGEGWIDERTMLQVEVSSGGLDSPQTLHALNDVLIGRGGTPRVVYVDVSIVGEHLTTYKVDGVIMATATGSTGYNLAVGGPIIYPQAEEMILNPISPHLGLTHAMILSPETIVDLELHTDHEATFSIDGQINIALQDGARVNVRRSSHKTRLLRIHPPSYFYATLEKRLKG
ncbi:MAG: NAD(+)/NADH kinase [Chloroflexota bacterium]|nr:NAD(+)/NADH kinase [Chloroflexota bacterium]